MTRSDVTRTPRLRWPLVVLFVSIGLTAVAAIDAERAVRSQQAIADKALREYANFAAWSYGQHLGERLQAITREALGAVNHGDNLHTNAGIPRARDLAHYLPWDPSCMCHRARAGPNPETFFALRIGEQHVDVGVNTHLDPTEGWEVDRPPPVPLGPTTGGDYTPAEKQWLADSLTRRIRGAGAPDHGYTLLVGNVERVPHIIAYTLMPTSWGDTMVYGARYAPAQLSQVLGDVLDGTGLLPSTITEGHRNRDVVAIRVRDEDGDTLFDSDPGVTSTLAASLDLPTRAGQLSVDAFVRPELAGSLLIGGLPQSHLPFLLGLLMLAAALSAVAVVQLRREGELSGLRADFVSSVSHELRTPLAQIRLYAETLRLGRAHTDQERDWSLGHIERETARLTHLVEQTLRFSRLGQVDTSPGHTMATIDVGCEVERIVDEFRPLAESRRATLTTAISAACPARLPSDALRHIVLNLLDNAVKYGPPGQTVSVSVNADNREVTIAVTDQGPGVAASERERIWLPFARGRAAKAQGGSGIGLTIGREVAEQQKGRAWVQSGPAGGASFSVALPLTPPGPMTD
jgi:signal transduction histidine kinase